MSAVNPFPYRYAHHKSPAGTGRWTFSPGDGAGHIYVEVKLVVSGTSYREACRQAKKKLGGYPEVYLLP